MKQIRLVLSEKEADQLFIVATNGYGDGDYYFDRSKRDHAAFMRALRKLKEAMKGKKLKLLWSNKKW